MCRRNHIHRAGRLQRDLPVLLFLVALTLVLVTSACAADVPWLKDVTAAPTLKNPPTAEWLGKMDPLFISETGTPISTRAAWETERQRIRSAWLQFLGSMPDPRPAVQLEVLSSESLPELTRQLVRYESEPGLFVEGYLLKPLSASSQKVPLPGIVALHQTTDASIDEIAGVSGPDAMQTGLKLAKRGYIVFCPRCFLWQNAATLNEAVAIHRSRHPHTSGMAKMLYDAMRGVDVLVSLPEVDGKRIGATGHSLGAKEVLYLTAFDERIKVGVASEGGTAFRATNWNAAWYLGPAIDDPQFPLNHHQLLALVAPRSLLILGGESGPGAADGDRSWPLIEAAAPAWKFYGSPVRLGLLNHHEGHTVSPESFERMTEWLKAGLED